MHPPQNASLYGAHAHAPGLWDRRADPAQQQAQARPNWPVLPTLDINLARQRSAASASVSSATLSGTLSGANGVGSAHHKAASAAADAYSPQLPARPWSSATSSTASSSSGASYSGTGASGSGGGTGAGGGGGGGSAGAQANAFPTLNSAFFPPHESPATKALELAAAASAGSPASAAPHDFYGRRASAEHAHQNTPASAQTPFGAPWSQQQYSRPSGGGAGGGTGGGGGGQRVGAGAGAGGGGMHAHPMSPYSLQAASPGADAGGRMGFWDDRYGGR